MEQSNWPPARIILEEGFDIDNRLAAMFPDLPDFAELPPYFSHQLNALPEEDKP